MHCSAPIVLRGLFLLQTPDPPEPALSEESEPQRPDDAAIFAGDAVEVCAWPSVVGVTTPTYNCTGTLIHPNVVVYAAHCGVAFQLTLGESMNGGLTIEPERCGVNPDWPQCAGPDCAGSDWAFCTLSRPAGLPVVPPLHGSCELAQLQEGSEVALVGYGETESGAAGTKHWGLTTLTEINTDKNYTSLGGGGASSVCSGDSGGPALVRLDDGGWRVFGIAHASNGGCGGDALHAFVPGALAWIEEQSGYDVTPCYEGDEWSPSAECRDHFAAEPGVGVGLWRDSPRCEGTEIIVAPQTCGPPVVGDDDDDDDDDVDPPPATDGTDGDSGSESSDGNAENGAEAGDTEDADAMGEGESDGCACDTRTGRSGGLSLLLFASLAWFGRRYLFAGANPCSAR